MRVLGSVAFVQFHLGEGIPGFAISYLCIYELICRYAPYDHAHSKYFDRGSGRKARKIRFRLTKPSKTHE